MSPDCSLQKMMERSSLVLGEAEYLMEKGAWNMVVRRSQESVELALQVRSPLGKNRGCAHPRCWADLEAVCQPLS
jgi:hypothetical protein